MMASVITLRKFIFPALLICLRSHGNAADPNLDESKVVKYVLPDPLTLQNGKPVKDSSTWFKQRRPEILESFATQMFGRTPPGPYQVRFETLSNEAGALGGKAVRKQIRVFFSTQPDGPRMDLLLYVPTNARKPVPVFLGLNFGGNHTVHADPGIQLGEVWVKESAAKLGYVRKMAPENSRGSGASRWQVEMLLDRGYAVATTNYQDIEPDFSGGIVFGVRPLFFRKDQSVPDPDEWGAIGAWAWGLSRAVDYLVTDKDIDPKRIALVGHSRLGKAALWAGAQDTRFALVVSNNSGEGGAALSRRNFGEDVERLNTVFPHWYCGNYRQYSHNEANLPFDSHMLLALIAPRPLYVASASEDLHSDPRGEFLAAVSAGRVYALLGKKGLETDQMPPVQTPIGNDIAYHLRAGKHDITAYDWEQYLRFADKRLAVP